jgi:DNA-binding MarR family transcriptional regulator/GNAT superfamily N-acetyltransferase
MHVAGTIGNFYIRLHSTKPVIKPKIFLGATLTDSIAIRRAEAVRHFNRFYTQHIGALHERLQKSPFSLTEVRVLHELTRGRAQTASGLARNLGLDSGYLSRLLTSFERRALITRRPSESDARLSLIALTEQGHAAHEPLDAAATAEVLAVLERLQPTSQEQLIGAMKMVERLLSDQPQHGIITLRAPRAGEYGWLVHRQALLFACEHDWDLSFEGLLARVVADFTQHHDPLRETCWIAEQDGTVVGSALLIGVSTTVARIRLLYIEPDMRRLGIGTQLVDECVRFAKRAGYTKLTLSTATTLEESRRLCERAGFICAGAAPEVRFGHELTIERWERDL